MQTYEYPCTCNNFFVSNSYQNVNDSSSSSEDEEYFNYIIPLVRQEETRKLIEILDQPLKIIKPLIGFYDNRMNELTSLLSEPKRFFVAENESKRIPFLMTLPNSYIHLIKKQPNSKDPICAPSYLSYQEITEFTKPIFLDEDIFFPTKGGLGMKYDLDERTDVQSNYILYQRQFYEKLLKERLVNKTNTKSTMDYDIPTTCYEPVSFLKRFCDIFTYLSHAFDQIVTRVEEEEYVLKKLNVGIYSGFNKSLASNGIPLPPLIGETYQVTDASENLILFAEVKNDKPIKIVYNLRYKGRKIQLDGYIDIKYGFVEDKDEIVIKTSGVNIMKLKKKNDEYKYIYFNLPPRISYKGIVDTINLKNERHVTVDGVMYMRGDVVSTVTGFNYFTNSEVFNAFYGLMTKKILNYDSLQTGHSFIGVVFHNSGFSFEGMKGAEKINEFFNRKIKKDGNNPMDIISSLKKKRTSVLEKEVGKKSNTNSPDVTTKNSPGISPQRKCINTLGLFGNLVNKMIKEERDEKNPKSNPNPNSPEKKATQSLKGFLKGYILNQISNKNVVNNIEKKVAGMSNNLNSSPNTKLKMLKISKKRINKNPYNGFKRMFLRVNNFMNKVSKTGRFITCFSLNFIYKICLGSWANLNFFEINYGTGELVPFYLKFKIPAIKALPISQFNLKKGLKIVYDNFHFFQTLQSIYGDSQWRPIIIPLNTDTGYREDLLWLLRFHQLIAHQLDHPSREELEEYERNKMEMFINADKWKSLIEGYTHIKISEGLNREEEIELEENKK